MALDVKDGEPASIDFAAGIPRELVDRDVASFWAWLTDSCVVEVPKPDSRSSANKDAPAVELRIVSRQEIKGLIGQALEIGDQRLADKLIEAAATPQDKSVDLVRKSLRLGKGEYLSLYLLKLKENISFSNVIPRLATPRIMQSLAQLRTSNLGGNPQVKQRINHLAKQVELWEDKKPESRTKQAQWEPITASPSLQTNRTQVVDDYSREDFPEYVLAEVHRRIAQEVASSALGELYQEFQIRWRKQIEANPLEFVSFEASIDPKDDNALRLVPSINVTEALMGKDLKRLNETYGEDEVKQFVGIVNRAMDIPAMYKEISSNEPLQIMLGLNLPSFYAKATGPKIIEITFDDDDESFNTSAWQNEIVLQELISRLTRKIGLDHYKYLKSENSDATESRMRVDHRQLTDLIKIATKMAETPADFAEIKAINDYRKRVSSYENVKDTLRVLVGNTLESHSVVSFYVNVDVWRLLPLVLRGTNWYVLANESSHPPKK